MYYLVDYENTHNNGLDGIEKLRKKDKVVIFYSLNVNCNVPFYLHTSTVNCRAEVKYKLISTQDIPSALDFQISTYLGYLIGTKAAKKFVIVSKDKGYQVLLDFWKNHNKDVKIIFSPTIRLRQDLKITKSNNEMLKKISTALKSKNFTDKQIQLIYSFFEKARNNTEFNLMICNNFKENKGIYAATKQLFYEYKQSQAA